MVSIINTLQYNLARFSDTVINPVIPSTHMLNPTNEFLSKLNSADLRQVKSMSYDVEHLFANVSLDEAINMLVTLFMVYIETCRMSR